MLGTVYDTEFDKLNVQLLKESKEENNLIEEITNTEVIFSNGNKYTYESTDKTVYLNDNIKICENVTAMNFTLTEENNKQLLTVSVSIDDKERKTEYIMATLLSPKVGDYVNYTPEGTEYSKNYPVLATYSGYGTDQIVYLQETLWRIMDIKEDGRIYLISEYPLYIGNSSSNKTSLYFRGPNGYNNGVELLNTLCDELYGDGTGAIEARNLNVEDIQDKMNTDVWNWTAHANSYVDTKLYGGTATYTSAGYISYPERWRQEIAGTVDGESTGGTLKRSDNGEALIPSTSTISRKAEESITITQNYWTRVETYFNGTNFTNPKHYELFIKNDSTNYSYWLSSRCINAYELTGDFGIYRVGDGRVRYKGLFYPKNNPSASGGYQIRPVITLEPNINLLKDATNSTNDITYWKFN